MKIVKILRIALDEKIIEETTIETNEETTEETAVGIVVEVAKVVAEDRLFQIHKLWKLQKFQL